MLDTTAHVRVVEVRLVDTKLGVWQNDANDPSFHSDVFRPLLRWLRDHGWGITRDPRIEERYRSLRHNHRLLARGNLRGSIEICGRHIEIEVWAETWHKENQNGHRYDFNKRQRMDYLDRLRLNLLEQRVIAWLRRRAEVSVHQSDLYRDLPAMERIAKAYAESWHTDKELGRPKWHSDHSRRSADGCLLEHGQPVWVPDRKGRILRGRAFYNINNMWWVVVGPDRLMNEACFHIFAKQPEDLRRKRNERERRRRLESEIASAVAASDYLRAATLHRITFGEAQAWRIWSRKNDCYYAPQYSGYTVDANRAGRYTREEARAEVLRVPHHLHAIGPDGQCYDFKDEENDNG